MGDSVVDSRYSHSQILKDTRLLSFVYRNRDIPFRLFASPCSNPLGEAHGLENTTTFFMHYFVDAFPLPNPSIHTKGWFFLGNSRSIGAGG